MNVRLLAALVAALAGVSACATVRPNAATVGDVEIHRNDFESEMQKLSGAATAPIEQTRSWLTDRVRFAVADLALDALHLSVSDENRTAGETAAKAAWSDYDALPENLQTRLRDGFAAEAALAATQPQPTDQTVSQALGGQDGPLCLTVIPAKDENDAKAAIADLTAGKTLEEVVTPRVAGSELEATKGAVLDQSGNCPPASQLVASVTQALADVKLNAPSAPVQLTDPNGQTVWFVFVTTKAGSGDIKAVLAGLKAHAADVSVDSRYGRWDPETFSVVAPAGA